MATLLATVARLHILSLCAMGSEASAIGFKRTLHVSHVVAGRCPQPEHKAEGQSHAAGFSFAGSTIWQQRQFRCAQSKALSPKSLQPMLSTRRNRRVTSCVAGRRCTIVPLAEPSTFFVPIKFACVSNSGRTATMPEEFLNHFLVWDHGQQEPGKRKGPLKG